MKRLQFTKIGLTLEEFKRLGYPWRLGLVLVGLQFAAVAFEGIGVGMLLPIFQIMQHEGDLEVLAESAFYWRWLIDAYGFVGLTVNLANLMSVSFLLIVIRQGLKYLQLVYYAWGHEFLNRRVRDRGFALYLHADASAHDRVVLGRLVNDLVVEAPRSASVFFNFFGLAGPIFLVIVYAGLLFTVSPLMTVTSLLVMTLTVGALAGLIRQSKPAGSAITLANQNFSAFLLERLRATRLIRLAGTEEAELENVFRLTRQQQDRIVVLEKVKAKTGVIMEPIALAIGFIVMFIGKEVLSLELETMLLFLIVTARLLPVTREAVKSGQVVLGNHAALDALYARLHDLELVQEQKGGSFRFVGLKQAVRLQGVSFDYGTHTGAPALNDVTVDIQVGRMTALVGPSGAGKSTFVDLLPRLRNPTAGRIFFDDTPIEEFDLASLRAGIAYLPQSPQIFNVAAADHIRYGRPDATAADIRGAARLAGADEFIDALPDGYNTLLGEGGSRLSVGERQRLDLARALVRHAPILILDEPTSALDAESEEKVRFALRQVRDQMGTTILVIAHRLSTVQNADQIIVLQRGSVAAVGSHNELIAAGGWYADAYASQFEAGELARGAAQ